MQRNEIERQIRAEFEPLIQEAIATGDPEESARQLAEPIIAREIEKELRYQNSLN